MNPLILFSTVLMVLGTSTRVTDIEAVREEFKNPPMEARPRVWWHWEDGNVTKDGIRKDLEWMKRIGIGGYHHFDAGMAQAPVVENRMIYMDEDWQDAFRYAIAMSDSLGFTVGVASSPGWSNTGGPWVSRDDAMKRLVWSSVDVCGGEFDSVLPTPGSYDGYYRDIKTVAIKLPKSDGAVRAVKVIGNGGRPTWNIQPYEYNLVLECSNDGVNYSEVGRIPQSIAPSITVNVPATTAEHFRIRDINDKKVPEYTLFTRSRVERSEEKSAFSSPYDLNEFPTVVADGEVFSDVSDVIDLTGNVSEEGRLVWNVPEGEWRIIRFGYTLTGKKNGPAPVEATGLEVDKLDQDAYHRYFIKYLDMYRNATGGMIGKRGITELLVDSYEAGWQTWTPGMFREFEARRGYSLIPWLPALTGEIIISAEQTEKFLFDWRRTISDLYAASYASVKDIAAEYGIETVCLESQENGRIMVADGMDIKRHASVPMAAIWTEVPFRTGHSTTPIAIADIRESASLVNIYGGRWVGAESFTTNGNEGKAYSFTPERLKRLADTEFASGVNRFFIHESSHQPLDDCRPGLGLSRYGQWFTRHETWAEQACAWTDYLARSSYMLSLGANVADILVYYGEDTNVTSKYGVNVFPVPQGYNYDFINANGLADLTVKNGRIVAPSGASYAVLCLDIDGLPQSDEAKINLEKLAAAGARICRVENLADAVSSVARDFDGPAQLRYVHRNSGNVDIYWVDNASDDVVIAEVSLRSCAGAPTFWNPETGDTKEVSYRRESGRTYVSLNLNPDDAGFIVLGGAKAKKSFVAPSAPQPKGNSIVIDKWNLSFPEWTVMLDSLVSYTEFDTEEEKYFSGTTTYTSFFDFDGEGPVSIDLGSVCDLCELYVNGKNLGILWRAPFKADISSAVKKGENTIEVKVINTWVNRLIGDAQPDCEHKTTYTTGKFYKADSKLLPAGLLGPVVVTW